MKRTIFALIFIIPLLLKAAITIQVTVPIWNVSNSKQVNALPVYFLPGNPALPYYPIKVLLPMGETVENIQIELNNNQITKNNLTLDYVRNPQPISLPRPDDTVKNPLVWNVNAFYPNKDFDFLGEQQWKGYRLAIINVYPWHYNPVTKQLQNATSLNIRISTIHDKNLYEEQNRMLVDNYETRSILQKVVANPEDVSSYMKNTFNLPQTRTINLTVPKKLIIITSQNRISWFNNYINWKNNNNIPTGIFAMEDIVAEYYGIDNADKLRNFIEDAYLTWSTTSTPLEYVILAGDDEIIPIRGAYGRVGETIDEWMPCDLYYGCLDGSWNYDGDNLWGEYPADQPDLLPEVLVGRFPAETQTEFEHIMSKTMYYVNNATYSNNIAQFYGENLNWNPVTWGCDYKDDVALHLPAEYELYTYYQRDGTYSPTIVWNSINSGAAIMNHMGHANETFLMGQSNATVESLQNTEYGFLYSQGCYPAAFDQRTSGDGESIGEHLVTTSGGLFAFIGNTRYGWYSPGSIQGPSQQFDRAFFIGMFEQNLPRLGNAMEYSLLQNVNNAMQIDVMRWCYYETILFGDPSIAVKAHNPNLPCLALESYHYSDIQGDNDGNINPGELIRLYPRVRNLPNWNTAYNIIVNTEGLPNGVVALAHQINAVQLAAGAYLDSLSFISFQIPNDLPFGVYNYTIRLRCYDPVSNALVCDRKYKAEFEITLLDSHFPWECNYSGKSAPIVADFDNDGAKDILYVDVTGDSYFINRLGVQFTTFNLSAIENINRSFAMEDINNDDIAEFAFCSRTGNVWTTDLQGTQLWSFNTGNMLLFTPVIANLDGLSGKEVIVCGHDRKIYAFDNNGNQLPGFPVLLTGVFNAELAVANIDEDDQMEIIAGTSDGKLWIINHDGSIQPGFPVQLNGAINGAPLVLDNNRIAVGTRNHFYLVSPQGIIITTKTINGDMAGGAIPVDIVRNGILDLVFVTSSGLLYACTQTGDDLAGFPVNLNTYVNCPPLAADIDGDQQYEIIIQSYLNSIYIVNHNGSLLNGFPFTTSYNGATPATLIDFDQDNNYELVSGFSNGVLVIKLRRPLGNMDAWTVYRGSLNRQGSFAATGFVANEDEAMPFVTYLLGNYPNPFNPITTIRFSLNSTLPVLLELYNAKGQKIKTLIKENMPAGRHQIIWNGKDEQDKPVSSGIYLYKLTAGSYSNTKKMLLLQ